MCIRDSRTGHLVTISSCNDSLLNYEYLNMKKIMSLKLVTEFFGNQPSSVLDVLVDSAGKIVKIFDFKGKN